MEHISNFETKHIASKRLISPQVEMLIKEQLIQINPNLANNLHQLRREMLKKIYENLHNMDSTYFIG